MENQDTLKYISNMLEHINQTVSVLAVNQLKLMQKYDELNERIDTLDEKIDRVDQKVDRVDQKVDAVDQKVDAVNEKVDKNHEEVIKEIKGLREDVDTIYDLEMDTRKTVKQNSKNIEMILKILNSKNGYKINNRFIN